MPNPSDRLGVTGKPPVAGPGALQYYILISTAAGLSPQHIKVLHSRPTVVSESIKKI